ncbi:MAG: zinc metalloprotease [Planctomycetes bacterium]|nr:zinc metalloprotease [Planctomycetota bacterium]MCP4771564.1 zinc metalloprotease [Planctomycetota bacterium]MCP4861225.1 zinc metalloprotease [Planctomycetota bacterium]
MSHRTLLIAFSLLVLATPAWAQRKRCGTPERAPITASTMAAPSDCGYWTNSPQPEYDPNFFYDIPVVFHVIQNTSGDGYLSADIINDQIDVLNEDFQAIAGSPGAPGTNGKIRFHLATSDPQGNPTTGITYTTNNTWYMDSGNYWDPLAWDTNRYLNIYTNVIPCCYGYVADFPQTGIVGTTADRVVLWWEAVGKNPTSGWPGNMGRTGTHEVGHYLGLYHTFDSGCGSSSNCYGTGDLICDTNGEQSATLGCPSSKSSCGNSDPFHNYMDYTDDACLWEFTPEQVNRMRCILEHWRPDLAQQFPAQENVRLGSPANPVALLPGQTNAPLAGEIWDPKVDHSSFVPAAVVDVLLISYSPVNLPQGAAGTLLCQRPFVATIFNYSPGTPFQVPIPNNFSVINAPFYAQAASKQGGGSWQLTNGLDCVVGNQ